MRNSNINTIQGRLSSIEKEVHQPYKLYEYKTSYAMIISRYFNFICILALNAESNIFGLLFSVSQINTLILQYHMCTYMCI